MLTRELPSKNMCYNSTQIPEVPEVKSNGEKSTSIWRVQCNDKILWCHLVVGNCGLSGRGWRNKLRHYHPHPPFGRISVGICFQWVQVWMGVNQERVL